jgi:hypothetical protein
MQWRQIAAIFAVLGCALAASACESQESTSMVTMRPGETVAAKQPVPPQAQPAADPRFLAADLPLLPVGVDRGVLPLPVIRAAYEFAARHPEVMHYVPCFCGCERGGHKDNHDCFVSGRDAANHVTAWEPHGLVCEICLGVAQQARQMHESGASITAIRAAIEQKYAAIATERGNHTPTPMPKHGGAHN